MRTKTCRTLQSVAFFLFVLALLACVALFFLQTPVKRLYGVDEQVLAIRSIPYHSIIACLVYVILALVWLLVTYNRPSQGTIAAAGIVLAIFFGVFDAILLPAGNRLIAIFIGRQGVDALASNATLEEVVSSIRVLLTVPAKILMFLSIGGMLGQDPPKP
ncbi:MAG: hypothetical protein IJT76_00500 [Clostridia bacterium]|nr:hypothetical protein [Clostridia bacterium]